MTAENIGDADQQRLDSLLQAISSEAGFRVGLNDLIRRWNNFVSQVENEYKDSLYEYANDLSTRDIIERVLRESPATVSSSLFGQVEPLDARFLRATREVNRPIQQQHGQPSFWWYRVPAKPSPELHGDLQSEGIVS